jgi:hypothetical protein
MKELEKDVVLMTLKETEQKSSVMNSYKKEGEEPKQEKIWRRKKAVV